MSFSLAVYAKRVVASTPFDVPIEARRVLRLGLHRDAETGFLSRVRLEDAGLAAAVPFGAGCVGGPAVGWAAARAISAVVTARTAIAVTPALGMAELNLAAAFFCAARLLALIADRRPVAEDRRDG